MIKRLVCAAVLGVGTSLSAQAVDTAGVGAITDQAMQHSEVMKNLEYLSDVIGPRLTGSTAARR